MCVVGHVYVEHAADAQARNRGCILAAAEDGDFLGDRQVLGNADRAAQQHPDGVGSAAGTGRAVVDSGVGVGCNHRLAQRAVAVVGDGIFQRVDADDGGRSCVGAKAKRCGTEDDEDVSKKSLAVHVGYPCI